MLKGLQSFEKQKALFGWLMKDKSDICFLQESYSTPEVEKIWKSQWKGEVFFSHGTERSKGAERSKGVLILINNCLEFELKTSKVEQNGRFIFWKQMSRTIPFSLLTCMLRTKQTSNPLF